MQTPAWQPVKAYAELLSAPQFSWLAYRASLTAALKAKCNQFQFRLLGESKQYPTTLEQQLLAQKPEDVVSVREVFLGQPSSIAVYGRTIFTSVLLNNTTLAANNHTPLGEWLFDRKHATRGEIYAAPLAPGHALWQQASPHFSNTNSLWARYSAFDVNHLPLLIYEVFAFGDCLTEAMSLNSGA